MRGPQRTVWIAFALSVAIVGLCDAIVLELVKAYFSSGFNSRHLTGPGDILAFFALGAVLDASVVAACWALLLPIVRLARLSALPTLTSAALLSVGALLSVDLAMHQLHRVFGDVVKLDVLWGLAAGRVENVAGEVTSEVPALIVIVAAALAGLGLAVFLARRSERRWPALRSLRVPSVRRLLLAALLLFPLAIAVLAGTDRYSPTLHFGLGWKPSAKLVTWLGAAATDFDGDGFGVLLPPRDLAPFDRARGPLALDQAGDGIDEDGIGGDLPADFRPNDGAPAAIVSSVPERPLPDVLLVFLEGVRADAVGARLDGIEVTPFLSALAGEGLWLPNAYCHVPRTPASRGQLLQGRVAVVDGGTTIVDDLAGLGYETAWFSGQDDSVDEGTLRLGLDRIGHFWDARSESEHRTSRSTAPISLQVSWKTVLAHVEQFLPTADPDAPLFLYVNFVDTHFPYWHAELDDLLGVGALPRRDIRPENAERVRRAYLGAVANVDLAIRQLYDAVRDARPGRGLLMIVTSDHGQALYEAGVLGHGQQITAAMTHVPFIVVGARGDWPQPLALSDVRSLLARSLRGTDPGPLRSSEDATREIFQHTKRLAAPGEIGVRDLGGVTIVDPLDGSARRLDPMDHELHRWPPGADDPSVLDAIRTWEWTRLSDPDATGPADR